MSGWHRSNAPWRAVALQAKRRDGWRCTKCGSRVRLEVDHRIPRHLRPDLALDVSNLQTLCRNCHIDKTAIENGMTPARREWQRVVNMLANERQK